jgi:Rrf2 family protein
MATSTRFVVAVHVLTLMAHEDRPITSEYAAGSANTNPVVIRRILGSLAKAGFVATQEGKSGGSRLTRAPAEINLLEVFRAVETDGFFALHSQPPNADCVIGGHIQEALSGTLDEAQRALEDVLAKTSLAQVLTTLRAIHHK